MRSHVDTEGATREYGHSTLDEICRKIGGNPVAVRRRCS
jgi:hypothetical protein